MKAFVTFRVAGADLDPDELSALFEVLPTRAHRKGEEYTTGRGKIVAGTGVWMFSTDRISLSTKLHDHFRLAMFVLGLVVGNDQRGIPGVADEAEALARILRLRDILQQKSLTATLTLFWHGEAGTPYPTIPKALADLFSLVPIAIEPDFDREESPSRRSKAA